jgi:hypothetical protein
MSKKKKPQKLGQGKGFTDLVANFRKVIHAVVCGERCSTNTTSYIYGYRVLGADLQDPLSHQHHQHRVSLTSDIFGPPH